MTEGAHGVRHKLEYAWNMVGGTESGVVAEYMERSGGAGKEWEKGKEGKWEGRRRDHNAVYAD